MENKTPTQEQFQTVIDNLKKANKMAKGYANIHMMEGIPNKAANLCGTPLCHGGWYCIGKGLEDNWKGGMRAIAEDLGFDDEQVLKTWANQNPQIWGNEYGGSMFCDGVAFGKKHDNGFTLQTIINHWKGVKKRALKQK